jgi:two-component sensor histidine kinase/PAS domain-containing protein
MMRKYDMTVRVVGDLAAIILAACRTSFDHCRRGTTMQWFGETLDAPITGSIDADVEQVAMPFGRDLLYVLQAMQNGDFSIRMAVGHDGLAGQIADAVNVLAAANQRLAQQLERLSEEVGRDGRVRQRVALGLSGGNWSEMEDQLNRLIDNLLWPTIAVTRAVAAVASGDLTRTIALDIDGRPLKGDFLQLVTVVNAMIRQFGAFTAEMTRVGRQVAEGAEALARSQRRLQDSEDSHSLALTAGKMGSWDWDLATGHCRWDAGQRQILGADLASFEVALPGIRALVHRNDWKMLCRQLKWARRNGGAWQLEFRVRRPDGSVRWCLGTAIAARDASGRVDRIRGVTMDITERKESEDRQVLLAREVDHRTKNALAVVHAIVSLTRVHDIDQFSTAVEGRIQALARAHSLLSDSRWRGAKIADLIQGELAPFRTADPERVRMSGRSMTLHPSAVQALALAVHELAANAARHGALSAPAGRVQIAWEQHGDELALQWSECGGPNPLLPMHDGMAREGLGLAQDGLGMRIIRACVETQLCGSVEFDRRPDGVVCAIRVPCHPKPELSGDFLHSIQNPAVWRRTAALS